MTLLGRARQPGRWQLARRPSRSILVLMAAGLVSLAVALPSFWRTSPSPAQVQAQSTQPPLVDESGIAPFIDLASLDVAVSTHRLPPPTISGDAARRIALATASAGALLPVVSGRGVGYRVVVNTITAIGLSSSRWPAPCDCWILTLGVAPQPPLSVKCVASNPPIGEEEAVVIIDAVSGVVLTEGLGGGLPWVAGQGCAPAGRGVRLS